MTRIIINDLRKHDFGDIKDSECIVNVTRSGRVDFNGNIKVKTLDLKVATSGQIRFNQEIIANEIKIEVLSTAGIGMDKVKSGNANIIVHTGEVYLAYRNYVGQGRIDLYANLHSFGHLYVAIPKGSSVCVEGQDGYSNIDYKGFLQKNSDNCDFYIRVEGKKSSHFELRYLQ